MDIVGLSVAIVGYICCMMYDMRVVIPMETVVGMVLCPGYDLCRGCDFGFAHGLKIARQSILVRGLAGRATFGLVVQRMDNFCRSGGCAEQSKPLHGLRSVLKKLAVKTITCVQKLL